MKIVKRILVTLGIVITLLLLLMKFSGISMIGLNMHDPIVNTHGVALDGYDVVAYFTESAAVEGKDEFVAEWEGLQWKFSSEAHKWAFESNPKAYAPQCGGHCAFAASTGFAVKGDPKSWRIVRARLYILSNPEVEKSFDQGGEEILYKVDENWK